MCRAKPSWSAASIACLHFTSKTYKTTHAFKAAPFLKNVYFLPFTYTAVLIKVKTPTRDRCTCVELNQARVLLLKYFYTLLVKYVKQHMLSNQHYYLSMFTYNFLHT